MIKEIKKCKHPEDSIFYTNSTNEDGWKCFRCNTLLGFRPDLDKKLIYIKARGIMDDLHEGKFITFSNGSEGEGVNSYLVDRCKKERRFDQHFIIRELFELKWKSHSDYWKEQSKIKEDKNTK